MSSATHHTWLSKLLDNALPGLPQFSRATIAGISVAITGNILISLALNCQKLAHRRLERERELQKTSNGKSTDRRGNGAKRNWQDNALQPTEEEEDGELTPTGLPLHQVSSYSGLETLPAANSNETQPLLPRVQSDGTIMQKTSLFKRIFPWGNRKGDTASSHSLIPVDIVVVEPSGAAGRQSSRSKRDKDQNNENGNESDYLKSKLWCV